MKLTYKPTGINNFHTAPAITLIVSGETADFNGPVYRINTRQAKRIQNHFCGITDCRCPHGAVIQLNEAGTEYGLPIAYAC